MILLLVWGFCKCVASFKFLSNQASLLPTPLLYWLRRKYAPRFALLYIEQRDALYYVRTLALSDDQHDTQPYLDQHKI